MSTDIESPVMARVRELIVPIATDLGLDLYDLEQRGGTLRVTLDTPTGSDAGITLDKLSLASRLVSKELDQHDPIPSRYTLEVTSPGVERTLRHPEHFRRETGKLVAVRLTDVEAADRRVQGVIVSADDTSVTLRLGEVADAAERVVPYAQIDRARTVFEWGPQPKPGHAPKPKRAATPASTDLVDTEIDETVPADGAAASVVATKEHKS
ncbi:MAG: ribosome maturation factor RimP [Acidimicrobiia bacterium]|nr:ribosome maturation factor RimP [Acidimicrobiia bacterium]